MKTGLDMKKSEKVTKSKKKSKINYLEMILLTLWMTLGIGAFSYLLFKF